MKLDKEAGEGGRTKRLDKRGGWTRRMDKEDMEARLDKDAGEGSWTRRLDKEAGQGGLDIGAKRAKLSKRCEIRSTTARIDQEIKMNSSRPATLVNQGGRIGWKVF